jgi:hypothetical protein
MAEHDELPRSLEFKDIESVCALAVRFGYSSTWRRMINSPMQDWPDSGRPGKTWCRGFLQILSNLRSDLRFASRRG